MFPRKTILLVAAPLAIALLSFSIYAQSYPSKPVRMVAAQAGGSGDFIARLIAQGLSSSFGQPVIVDNRGITAAASVANAPPDGHTLLFYGPPLWMGPLLRHSLPWDYLRDFSPITAAASSPGVLIVHPSLPVKSVRELIAFAAARPGQLNYSSGSTGGPPHLDAELFKAITHVDIVRVAHKGNASALISVMSGETHLMFANASQVIALGNTNKIRPLAITSAKRSPLLPNLPTLAESGVNGYESSLILGLVAPSKTPAAIISLLNRETVRVLRQPDTRQRILKAGMEPLGNTAEEFGDRIKTEIQKWGKLIEEKGMRLD